MRACKCYRFVSDVGLQVLCYRLASGVDLQVL